MHASVFLRKHQPINNYFPLKNYLDGKLPPLDEMPSKQQTTKEASWVANIANILPDLDESAMKQEQNKDSELSEEKRKMLREETRNRSP